MSWTPSAIRRVAVIAYHSSPLCEPGSGDAGGMSVYVLETARHLARLGISTDVFTRRVPGTGRIVPVAPGVRVVGVDAGPPRALDKERLVEHIEEFASGVAAFAATQRIAYDVVHSHYWQSGVAGLQLARRWGVPLIHSQHTLALVKNSFLAPGEAPEPPARIDGEARVISSADVLIASTDEEYRQLSCLYAAPHDRIKTVHPGVDHELFRPGDAATARARLGLDPEAAVVLYVGRIQPLKGLDLALRSVARLRDVLDRPVLFMVVGGASGRTGPGQLRSLRALASSLGMDGAVRFEGPRPHRRLPDYYRAADVLVMCSYSESFGLAALEAHACGTPVVSTAVGGLSHVVCHGFSGYLVARRDPEVFAAHLRRVLQGDPRTLSEAALSSASRFSWEATARALAELYDCMVVERAPEVCTC